MLYSLETWLQRIILTLDGRSRFWAYMIDSTLGRLSISLVEDHSVAALTVFDMSPKTPPPSPMKFQQRHRVKKTQ